MYITKSQQNEPIRKQTCPSVTLNFVNLEKQKDMSVFQSVHSASNCAILEYIKHISKDKHSPLESDVTKSKHFLRNLTNM